MPFARVTALVVLSATFLLAAPATRAAGPAPVVEKATGTAFPVTRTSPGAAAELELTGTGVRTKLIFKVYAFAFYVDPAAARQALARWSGKSAADLRNDPAFYAALGDLAGDRLVIMHFVRDVDSAKMKEAMDEAMDRGTPKTDPARAQFLGLWTGEIKDGEDVGLLFGADGKVTLLRAGKAVGSATSPAMARSILQSWLGPKPVSDDIRNGLAERFPEILKAR